MLDLTSILERRHKVMVEWCEPWSARDQEGHEATANITLRCSVNDAINLQRDVAMAYGDSPAGEDADRLLDFIAVHWAIIIDA